MIELSIFNMVEFFSLTLPDSTCYTFGMLSVIVLEKTAK